MVQNLIYNLCESFVKNIDGIASITKNTPPQEEILAPATFEVTANYVKGYYWATFYTSMANYQAPDGVLVQKVNFNGSQFTSINVEDGIINKRQGVVLRSSTSSITLTKTYSKSSDDYSNNSLIGTDYQITNPGNAYVLNYKQSHGLGFYHLSDTGRIKANAAYLVIPITYLTQWKIVGNSEVHGNEIWSCGEYNATDGKYHILVQPQGGSIADIALTEPLRKVNNVADTIEFPSNTDGKALVTRNIMSNILGGYAWSKNGNRLRTTDISGLIAVPPNNNAVADMICATYSTLSTNQSSLEQESNIAVATSGNFFLYDTEYPDLTTMAVRNQLIAKIQDIEIIFRLATPITELVDAPQIAEAESYSMVISQGGKAVEWSSFEKE